MDLDLVYIAHEENKDRALDPKQFQVRYWESVFAKPGEFLTLDTFLLKVGQFNDNYFMLSTPFSQKCKFEKSFVDIEAPLSESVKYICGMEDCGEKINTIGLICFSPKFEKKSLIDYLGNEHKILGKYVLNGERVIGLNFELN